MALSLTKENKSKITTVIKFTAYLITGVFLMLFVYRNYDMQEIGNILGRGINYWWLFSSLVLGLASHFSRTLRWQMIIEPIEKQTRISNTFFAVMIGYFYNLIIPRMGEISRCGLLSRYENISVSRLIGTVVAERLIDLICLILCLFLIVILQFQVVANSLANAVDIEKINGLFTSIWIYIIGLIIIGTFFLLRKFFIQTKAFFKLKELWSKFAEGFLSIRKVKRKGFFIFHTVFIWTMYFLMIYVCFFAFEFTNHLTPLSGLVVFVLGSIGMVVPVQGGMGAWHFLVILSLSMYGIPKSEGAAFALIVWSSINAMIVITGIISLIIMPIINKKKA